MLTIVGSFVMYLYSPLYMPSKIQSLEKNFYHVDVLQIKTASDARLVQACVLILLTVGRST
jgi:hypothetical protein